MRCHVSLRRAFLRLCLHPDPSKRFPLVPLKDPSGYYLHPISKERVESLTNSPTDCAPPDAAPLPDHPSLMHHVIFRKPDVQEKVVQLSVQDKINLYNKRDETAKEEMHKENEHLNRLERKASEDGLLPRDLRALLGELEALTSAAKATRTNKATHHARKQRKRVA